MTSLAAVFAVTVPSLNSWNVHWFIILFTVILRRVTVRSGIITERNKESEDSSGSLFSVKDTGFCLKTKRSVFLLGMLWTGIDPRPGQLESDRRMKHIERKCWSRACDWWREELNKSKSIEGIWNLWLRATLIWIRSFPTMKLVGFWKWTNALLLPVAVGKPRPLLFPVSWLVKNVGKWGEESSGQSEELSVYKNSQCWRNCWFFVKVFVRLCNLGLLAKIKCSLVGCCAWLRSLGYI